MKPEILEANILTLVADISYIKACLCEKNGVLERLDKVEKVQSQHCKYFFAGGFVCTFLGIILGAVANVAQIMGTWFK